ncbi:MAG: YraN family protein [Mariprofundales bacterium]|nr:YraN family protein [Mariprofundales bacterium]
MICCMVNEAHKKPSSSSGGTSIGRAGEEEAAKYLQRIGYTVLARNARAGRGELDIVARIEDIVAFVEVKTHQNLASCLNAVTPDKQRRLISAATVWLTRHPQLASLQCRFDLIAVTPARSRWQRSNIEHFEDAFRP